MQENPFAKRTLDIFIATDSGQMTFIEFLDMVSTFSPKNSREKKTAHAFQIFGKEDPKTEKILNEKMKSKASFLKGLLYIYVKGLSVKSTFELQYFSPSWHSMYVSVGMI
jgi:hypothetical protein